MKKIIRVTDGSISFADILKQFGKLEGKFFLDGLGARVSMDGYDTIKVLTDGTAKRNSSNAIYVIGSKEGKYESISIVKHGSPVKSKYNTLAEAEAQIPRGYNVCGKFASGNIKSPLPNEQVFVFGSKSGRQPQWRGSSSSS